MKRKEKPEEPASSSRTATTGTASRDPSPTPAPAPTGTVRDPERYQPNPDELAAALGASTGPSVQTPEVRQLTRLILDLERAGVVSVNRAGTAAAPQPTGPVTSAGLLETALREKEQLDKKLDEMAQTRGYKSNPVADFADTQGGAALFGMFGDIGGSFAKHMIRKDELGTEKEVEAMKLARAYVERGMAPPQQYLPNPQQQQQPPPQHVHVQPSPADPNTSARIDRLEAMLERALARAQSPAPATATSSVNLPPAPSQSTPGSPVGLPSGAGAAPVSSTPRAGAALVKVKCSMCFEIVTVEAANAIQVGDGYATVHGRIKHPKEIEVFMVHMLDLQSKAEKGQIQASDLMREGAKLVDQLYCVVPDAPAPKEVPKDGKVERPASVERKKAGRSGKRTAD